MPRPALHERFVPGIVKKGKTNCVCSGAHCAAVGGFAALRMRRAPLRVVSALYWAIQPREGAGAPRASLMCHCEEANGRRGNLGKAVTFSPGVPCDPTGFCEKYVTAGNYSLAPSGMGVPFGPEPSIFLAEWLATSEAEQNIVVNLFLFPGVRKRYISLTSSLVCRLRSQRQRGNFRSMGRNFDLVYTYLKRPMANLFVNSPRRALRLFP